MHPYSQLPEQSFWKRFVSDTPWRNLQLGGQAKFQLEASSKIATAGSCFAQHIARYLAKSGRSTYIAEQPHPLSVEFGGDVDSYKLFSARYGNVYTARQCLELFQQSLGLQPMVEDFMEDGGRIYDLLRPNAIPNGFSNLHEARADRRFHLACVRKMFETTDVFVFTLGLTESWRHATRGHTYPVCPGTARGTYDPEVHKFHNFTHAEVLADLQTLIASLQTVNPTIKIILTVSPVPLVATYTDQNVLVASSYSKSVLRAVCGEIQGQHAHIQYFPSFEIVGHVASFGQYLATDLREVAERGVSHVMACFFATFFGDTPYGATPQEPRPAVASLPATPHGTASLDDVECEEMFNALIR
jgi:hypothetical protein